MTRCHNCGGNLEPRAIRLVETASSGEPMLITNVPAKVCDHCGTKVYSSQVTDALLKILRGELEPRDATTLSLPSYSLEELAGVA